MHRASRARLTVALAVVSALVVGGCAAGEDPTSEARAAGDTIALAPGEEIDIDGSAPTDTETAGETAAPVTDAPVTDAPATDAPATDAPSSTSEPGTTVPTSEPASDNESAGDPGAKPEKRPKKATSTIPPVPLRPVSAPDTPFVAVGQASGAETARIQQRLIDLGFWNAGPDGSYGLTTTQAVMAFQKYTGLDASGAVDQATADALTTVTERPRGLSTAGDLIEIDKKRQLLFVIRSGLTELVLNTSTGNGEEYTEPDKNSPGETITGVSLTPNGLFRVDRERPEGWWEGDLGEIYRPKYFRGGVAVHGSNSIPNYPASHGCVRVSVPAMDMIWQFDLMPMWSTVWVHDGV